MSQHSDAHRFLQAVFPDFSSKAIFANLNPSAHSRDYTTLDQGRDCYWSIAAFPPEAKTNLGDNGLYTVALVIDDVGTKGPDALTVEMKLGAPTAIVETSPGNFQWTYRLSKPLVGGWAGFFAGVEARLGKALEARSSQTLARLPMGLNTFSSKTKKALKAKYGTFAVRLVHLDPTAELDPDTINHVAITGPGMAHGGGRWLKRIGEMMAILPKNTDSTHYDVWMQRLHQSKAIAQDEGDAWDAAEAWSQQSAKHDPDEMAHRWGTIHPNKSGRELLVDAYAANPDEYMRIMGAEARDAFDDGEVAPTAAKGVEFFIDQERSSIEVVNHFAGTLKNVGRGDWREFNPDTGRWREWTGDHMFRRVLELVNERKTRPMDAEVAKKLGSVKFIEHISRAAALHASMVGKVTDFDRAPLLLGVPSGVVDLRPGASRAVRKGRASEMVCKAMWVDPAPVGTACPEWSRFLGEFTQGDLGLEKWLQVRAGYCLTGLMDEPVMPFYHGSGGNGKSVYLNALRSVWGEYGTQMDHRLLFEKQGGMHLAPLAVLAGVRLAIVTDVPQNATWDVLIMKMLTGDDAITANRMHQNPITFKSTAKIDVSGNGEPTVKDMDDGIKRRLKMVPLTAKPKVIDKQLSRKLLDEYGAILAWALAGLDEYWRLGGFPVTAVVEKATDGYHAMLDPFQRWLDERVVKDPTPDAKLSTSDLFRSWDAFRCEEGRFAAAPTNGVHLGRKMTEKGFVFGSKDGRSVLRGYKVIKSTPQDVF